MSNRDQMAYPYTEPHVHCELIKAWADGAEIEIHNGACYGWAPMDTAHLYWLPHRDYRIKPNKADKDLQIEELERQAKQLASDITKLRGMGG